MALGEYRLSKDIDFLCADIDGYREIRGRVVRDGAAALFDATIKTERDFRGDQYGIRGIVSVRDIPLRFEIVREARVRLTGDINHTLGVPQLALTSQIAEKLLANADRCQDRSSGFRDAIDLGMLALHHGAFPDAALAQAVQAYGPDIGHKLQWAVDRLAIAAEREAVAQAIAMEPADVQAASIAFAAEYKRLLAAGVLPYPR